MEYDQRGGDQIPYPSMRYPTNTYDDRQQDVPFRYTNPRSEQAEASVPPPGDRDKYCQQQRQFEEFGGDKQQWILDKRPLPGDSVGSLVDLSSSGGAGAGPRAGAPNINLRGTSSSSGSGSGTASAAPHGARRTVVEEVVKIRAPVARQDAYDSVYQESVLQNYGGTSW